MLSVKIALLFVLFVCTLPVSSAIRKRPFIAYHETIQTSKKLFSHGKERSIYRNTLSNDTY